MRLLFVIDSLSTGGAQRQMVNLALGLAKRGHQVELFCYAPGDSLAKPLSAVGVPVHCYPKRGRFSPGVVWDLRRLLNRGRYDIVLSFLMTPNSYALMAARLLGIHRIPVVVSERSMIIPRDASLLERMVRQLYRLAAHVVTNAHHQRVSLVQQYPWLRNRLSTIYNGIDLRIFSPSGYEPCNHPLKVLVIASLSPQKNGLCLVQALRILRDRDQIFAGVDWLGRLPTRGVSLQYLHQINEQIADQGLEAQWHWLGERADVVAQLRQHDVLIHPAYIEGLPNVVCEALACGRPVIVSDTLDHAQLVHHGENGYLFDYRSPLDLADKIRMFINLPEIEKRRMGTSSRVLAEAILSQERLADDYEQLFISVLQSARGEKPCSE